jgi:hypothetical protein
MPLNALKVKMDSYPCLNDKNKMRKMSFEKYYFCTALGILSKNTRKTFFEISTTM